MDFQVVAKNDDADGVLFEIERQAAGSARKLDHFARHHAGESVDSRNAVADFEDASDLSDVDLGSVLFNLLLDN